MRWTRLSCTDFAANQVRLQLHALAYNLGNFLRRFALPASVKHWTLTTLRDKLIKIGAKVVRHARKHRGVDPDPAAVHWVGRAAPGTAHSLRAR